MTDINVVEVDQVVAEPRSFEKIWQTLWNMKPLLSICLASCVVVSFAIVVVLALIPTYLQARDVTLYRPDPVPFLVKYATNLLGKTGLTVANLKDLAAKFMTQIDLKGIQIIYAQLTSASASKKRRASEENTDQCRASTGDILVIAFTIPYANDCNYPSCELKFLKKVKDYITTLYQNITLPVTFTDGETLTIAMSCCSLYQTTSSTPPTTITTTTATTTTTTPSGCYYGEDQVDLVDGGQRFIKDLKGGERVWSITPDGTSYIEDEVIMMMHNEPNAATIFYTMNTRDGHHVSLTNIHVIPVYVVEENQIKLVWASEVTVKHRLIMFNQKVEIENITIDTRIGFFAPLTYSGYLLVNNISTSVYPDSEKVSPQVMHRIATPFRVYYRLMRWVYGYEYNPYETNVKEGLHPVPEFIYQHFSKVVYIDKTLQYILPMLLVMWTLRYFSRSLLK